MADTYLDLSENENDPNMEDSSREDYVQDSELEDDIGTENILDYLRDYKPEDSIKSDSVLDYLEGVDWSNPISTPEESVNQSIWDTAWDYAKTAYNQTEGFFRGMGAYFPNAAAATIDKPIYNAKEGQEFGFGLGESIAGTATAITGGAITASGVGAPIGLPIVAYGVGGNAAIGFDRIYDSTLEDSLYRGMTIEEAEDAATEAAYIGTAVEFGTDTILAGGPKVLKKIAPKLPDFIKKPFSPIVDKVTEGAKEVASKITGMKLGAAAAKGLHRLSRNKTTNIINQFSKDAIDKLNNSDVFRATVTEGIEEILQGIASEGAIIRNDPNSTIENLYTPQKLLGYLEQGAYGALGGGIAGAISNKLQNILRLKQDKTLTLPEVTELIQQATIETINEQSQPSNPLAADGTEIPLTTTIRVSDDIKQANAMQDKADAANVETDTTLKPSESEVQEPNITSKKQETTVTPAAQEEAFASIIKEEPVETENLYKEYKEKRKRGRPSKNSVQEVVQKAPTQEVLQEPVYKDTQETVQEVVQEDTTQETTTQNTKELVQETQEAIQPSNTNKQTTTDKVKTPRVRKAKTKTGKDVIVGKVPDTDTNIIIETDNPTKQTLVVEDSTLNANTEEEYVQQIEDKKTKARKKILDDRTINNQDNIIKEEITKKTTKINDKESAKKSSTDNILQTHNKKVTEKTTADQSATKQTIDKKELAKKELDKKERKPRVSKKKQEATNEVMAEAAGGSNIEFGTTKAQLPGESIPKNMATTSIERPVTIPPEQAIKSIKTKSDKAGDMAKEVHQLMKYYVATNKKEHMLATKKKKTLADIENKLNELDKEAKNQGFKDNPAYVKELNNPVTAEYKLLSGKTSAADNYITPKGRRNPYDAEEDNLLLNISDDYTDTIVSNTSRDEYGDIQTYSKKEYSYTGTESPATISKEHIYDSIVALSKKLNIKILNELGRRGVRGRAARSNTQGISEIDTKIENGKVVRDEAGYPYLSSVIKTASSRNHIVQLHEIGHVVYEAVYNSLSNKQMPPDILFDEVTDLVKYYRKLGDRWANSGFVQGFGEINKKEKKLPTPLIHEVFADMFSLTITKPQLSSRLRNLAPNTYIAIQDYLEHMNVAEDCKNISDLLRRYNDQTSNDRAFSNIIEAASHYTKAKNWFNKNFKTKEGRARFIVKIYDDTSFLKYIAKKLNASQLADKIIYYNRRSSSVVYKFISGAGSNLAGQDLPHFKNLATICTNLKATLGEHGEKFLNANLWANQTLGEYVGNNRVFKNIDTLAKKLNKSVYDVRNDFVQLHEAFGSNFYTDSPITKDTPYKGTTNNEKVIRSKRALANRYKSLMEDILDVQRQDKSQTVEEANALTIENSFVVKESNIRDTGLDIQDALNIINTVNNSNIGGIIIQATQDFYDWQESTLDYIAQTSGLAYQYVSNIRERGAANHIPLLRHFSEKTEYTSKAADVNDTNYAMARRVGSDRAIQDIMVNVQKQLISLVEAAHRQTGYETLVKLANEFGGNQYIQKIKPPLEHIKLATDNITATLKNNIISGINELYTDENQRTDALEEINSTMDSLNDYLESQEIITMNLFHMNSDSSDLPANVFSIYDPTTNKFNYYETDIALLDSINRPEFLDYANELSVVFNILSSFKNCAQKFYTTYNPKFVVYSNIIRDTVSLAIKGEQTNTWADTLLPVRLLYAGKYMTENLFKFWTQKGTASDILHYMSSLGLHSNQQQINMDLQKNYKLNKEGEVVPDNMLRAIEKHVEVTDKLATFAELRWTLKNMGAELEDINLSKESLLELDASKQTLDRHGITRETVSPILTLEQMETWNNTPQNKTLDIYLSKVQKLQLQNAIDWNKTKLLSQEDMIQLSTKARRAIIDFSEGGKVTRFLNQWILFSKARVNGIVQNYRWMRQHPVLALSYASQIYLFSLMRGVLFPNDDDDEEDSLTNITFPLNNGEILKLPLDTTWGLMNSLGDIVAREYVKENNELWDSMKDLAKAYFRNEGLAAVSSPHPALTLAANLLFNKDINNWTDSIPVLGTKDGLPDVVPEYLRKAYKGHPDKQVNNSTKPLAIVLGNMFNTSPITIDAMLRTILGSAPSTLQNFIGAHRVIDELGSSSTELFNPETMKQNLNISGIMQPKLNNPYVNKIKDLKERIDTDAKLYKEEGLKYVEREELVPEALVQQYTNTLQRKKLVNSIYELNKVWDKFIYKTNDIGIRRSLITKKNKWASLLYDKVLMKGEELTLDDYKLIVEARTSAATDIYNAVQEDAKEKPSLIQKIKNSLVPPAEAEVLTPKQKIKLKIDSRRKFNRLPDVPLIKENKATGIKELQSKIPNFIGGKEVVDNQVRSYMDNVNYNTKYARANAAVQLAVRRNIASTYMKCISAIPQIKDIPISDYIGKVDLKKDLLPYVVNKFIKNINYQASPKDILQKFIYDKNVKYYDIGEREGKNIDAIYTGGDVGGYGHLQLTVPKYVQEFGNKYYLKEFEGKTPLTKAWNDEWEKLATDPKTEKKFIENYEGFMEAKYKEPIVQTTTALFGKLTPEMKDILFEMSINKGVPAASKLISNLHKNKQELTRSTVLDVWEKSIPEGKYKDSMVTRIRKV